jgi:hypothetical protein
MSHPLDQVAFSTFAASYQRLASPFGPAMMTILFMSAHSPGRTGPKASARRAISLRRA